MEEGTIRIVQPFFWNYDMEFAMISFFGLVVIIGIILFLSFV